MIPLGSLSSSPPATPLLGRVGVQSEGRDLIERTDSAACNIIWNVLSVIILPIGIIRGIVWLVRKCADCIESQSSEEEKMRIASEIEELISHSEYERLKSILLPALPDSVKIEDKEIELRALQTRLMSSPFSDNQDLCVFNTAEEWIRNPQTDPNRKQIAVRVMHSLTSSSYFGVTKFQALIQKLSSAKKITEKENVFQEIVNHLSSLNILPENKAKVLNLRTCSGLTTTEKMINVSI